MKPEQSRARHKSRFANAEAASDGWMLKNRAPKLERRKWERENKKGSRGGLDVTLLAALEFRIMDGEENGVGGWFGGIKRLHRARRRRP